MSGNITDKQIKALDFISGITSFQLPHGLKNSDKNTASAWIDLALGAASKVELEKLGNFGKQRPSQDLLSRKGVALASYYQISPPANFTPAALRAWIETLGRHVPIPPQDRLLAYWKSALAYHDLNELAKDKTKHIAEKLDTRRLAESLPVAAADFEPGSQIKEGQAAALLLAYTKPVRNEDPSALLAIPLSFDRISRSFGPVQDNTAPFINREWLEPPDPDREKDKYFGTVEQCDIFFQENPPPTGASWPDYWQYVVSFVSAITDEENTLPNVAPLVGRRDTGWKIVSWQTSGMGSAIESVYEKALEGESAPLLRLLSGPAHTADVFRTRQAMEKATRLLGHMDVYKIKMLQRSGFALDRYQRIAATAGCVIGDGELLTVNGPPGTGKTSFLRAVIGTIWVEAAVDGRTPPIILATAATNKAVTNIIESFSEVPGPALEPTWESRWLPNLPSYGWFYPAASRRDDEYPNFMILRWIPKDERTIGPHRMTAAAADFSRDIETRRSWLVDQFLDLHRQCSGLSEPVSSPTEAAQLIQKALSASLGTMHDLQNRFQSWMVSREKHEAFKMPRDYWLSLQQEELDKLAEMKALCAPLEYQLKVLIEARTHIEKADKIDRYRTSWWYWLKSRLFGDALALESQALRSRANEFLAKHLPDEYKLLNNTESTITKLIKKLQHEVSQLHSAMQPHLQQEIRYRECVDTHNTWLEAGHTIVVALGSHGSYLQHAIEAWSHSATVDDTDPLSHAFESSIDLAFRYRHFHMTARYWEARWLDDLPLHNELHDTKKSLQRAAMLAPVFVSTAYTIPRILDEFGFADLLIFDESGQASPEIGAGAFAFAKRAVVVGDAWQLKPVWNLGLEASNRLAHDHEIDVMPFSHSAASGSIIRMAQTVSRFTADISESAVGSGVWLIAHYRCRRKIIEFCRRLIYHDNLVASRPEKEPFLYPPMAWVAVETKKGQERRYGSWVNYDQINEILKWLKHDGPRLLQHYRKDSLSEIVALIAPFRAQANALRNAIESEFGADIATNMVINTVHALQGAEKPIVAFSLTQVEGPFFVNRDGPNLLNVAVSRAQDCFVLFANPEIIGDTGKSRRTKGDPEPLWQLIDYLAEYGRRLYPREYVIIEAPGKERAVQDALGLAAKVVSTGGHFRDIQLNNKTITFAVTNKETVQLLRDAAADLNQYDAVFLATDDDEDGEEIAWHVIQVFAEEGVVDQQKFRRMRFYALTGGEICRAREEALPGIDARRVRASLLRKLVDLQLHEKMRNAGIQCSRPQLALLREIARREAAQDRWHVRVNGIVDGKPVTGYVVSAATASAPVTEFTDSKHAQDLVNNINRHLTLEPHDHFALLTTWPAYPPNTTAQMLISANHRLGWLPRRTMTALRALYEGRRKGRAMGDSPDDEATT